MQRATLVALAAFLVSHVEATVPLWGQCGGLNYTGDKTCAAGSTCTYQNDWYSQCLPSSTTTTSTTTTTTTTTTTSSSTSTTTTPTATGFVKTSGQKFTLNGSTYTVVGSNAYWLAQFGNSDIDKAFSDLQAAGVTTVRTWGFNDVVGSGSGTYYQTWSGSTGTLNTGANGLQKFDYVISSAKAHGIRLIVPLTNNWSDYGGMDVYVNQILGSGKAHDLFYTDATVKTAYKKYINGFVSRYVNEPGILGWELANEPRCKGSTGTTSGNCKTTTITQWATEISAYIKSIDKNHLVGIGDEGFFNQPSNPSYPYQGSEGIDFDANLAITSIDFGTFHSYPGSWGQTSDPTGWGSTWINDHAASQKSKNKPVIIEEFGVTSNQDTTYAAWWSAIVSSGLTGDLIWQAGSHMPSGDSWNDGYAVFPESTVYTAMKSHAAALKARG